MRSRYAWILAAALAVSPAVAFAEDAPHGVQPVPASKGVAVLGTDADAAWPLAQAVYADGTLRPAALDELHARILAGESPPADAAPDIRELAELRGGVHGDDAASRQLLGSIAQRFHVAGVLVLTLGEGDAPPSARMFLADGAHFDAVVYQPDDGSGRIRSWTGAVRSVARSMAPPSSAPSAPSVAITRPASASAHLAPKAEPKPNSGKPFYLSPWFWGAIGAAAFGAVAVFLATRDTSGGQIHLQMQVPK
jgi:hypothetical protein